MTRTPFLKRTHIIKLTRLLDMLYKPSELAEEIGVNVDTVCRSYLPAGAPYTRDDTGHIWIHGIAFAGWARETVAKKKRKRGSLPEDQAYCLKCKTAVPMKDPSVKAVNRYLEMLQSKCPQCGRTINRARKRTNYPLQMYQFGEGAEGGRGAS